MEDKLLIIKICFNKVMNKREKTRYLIGEICKKIFSCEFKDDFHGYFLNYLPDKSNGWELKYKMRSLGEIEKNDIEGVLKRLLGYYGDVGYLKGLKNVIKKVKERVMDGVIRMDKLDYDEDYLVLNYLEYWENLSYIVVYGGTKKVGLKMERIIGQNGDLLLVREMRLNRNELMGFLFWGNIRKSSLKTRKELDLECEAFGMKDDKSRIKVNIYFFAKDKTKTRDDMNFMVKRSELEIGDKGDKVVKVYGGFNYDDAISFGGLVMNITNLRYFNEVCWTRFLEMEGGAGKIMLIGIRNYLLDKVDGMDMKRFLIFSSMILYLYGLRRPSDVDILGYDRPKAEGGLKDLYSYYGTSENRILGYGELSVRGYGEWREGGKKEHLFEWFGSEWPRKFGAEGMEDMIFNPRFYISVMGLKVLNLSADMERRKIRFRPASYADLIAYNYFMLDPIEIEPPPRKYIVGGEVKSYETNSELNELLRKIKNYLRLRYDIRMTMKEIGSLLGVSEKLEGLRGIRDERARDRLKVYDRLRRKG
jgi:hypothetical protein